MSAFDIVVDTNVMFSALYSTEGASHRLLMEMGRHRGFQIHLSVPLVLEYEEVLKRNSRMLGLTFRDVDDLIDYLCAIAERHRVFYLWRPSLPDADDDMVLELAVAAHCQRIVTHNTQDFVGAERFGVQAIAPRHFLKEIGVLP